MTMEAVGRPDRTGLKVLGILLPFVLIFFSLFFISVYLYQTVLEETAYFSLLVGDAAPRSVDDFDTGFVPTERPERLTQIPSVGYGKQFARLNVTWSDGRWDIINVPVYLGADKEILKKGAGMSYASFFPGEGRCTIISAHVTRYFAELESTPVGATVTLETNYGPYRYEVIEKHDGVKGSDRWYMDSSLDYDLILYSCYPRDNGGKRRTERCVLCCTLTQGLEVSK